VRAGPFPIFDFFVRKRAPFRAPIYRLIVVDKPARLAKRFAFGRRNATVTFFAGKNH
jgi:hypothetical protein